MRLVIMIFAALCVIAAAPLFSTAQSNTSIEDHIRAARVAAGQEHTALLDTLCAEPPPPRPQAPSLAAPQPRAVPEKSRWHAEPVKVFDNLYYVGEKEYSAWAVTTSDGIIVVDAIFDYSIEDEVVNGLKTLGLDPAKIKYVIISHGHLDHAGGARFLQDRGAHIVASAADWELMAKDTGSWPKPKRDIVATDGRKLTLGGTTLILYLTPGHTLGTISTIIPVKDNGVSHTAALWGGTAFNWLSNRAAYITAERPDRFWFDTYINSVKRFRKITAEAGVDVVLSNHTRYDRSDIFLPMMAKRKAVDPNPFVTGRDVVQRYLTVAEECAQAGLARFQ